MERCKYYEKQISQKNRCQYRTNSFEELNKLTQGNKCPMDSGTDGKRNGICFQIKKEEFRFNEEREE